MKKTLMIAVAVTLALMTTGCSGGKKKQAQVDEAQKKVLVKTDVSQKQTVARTVDFTANLQAYKQNFVTPAVAARIENIYVEVGDRVTEGQVLVDLDKNQYNTYALQLANAEANLARMKPVYEAGGISKQQIDELETSISVLKENVSNLETNLQLRSPLTGIVTGRYNEVGDLYTMSPNAAGGVGVLQVMEMDRLKATVSVPEQYFPNVYMKMPVKVIADIYPDMEFDGQVTRIAPSINPTTRSFEVEVTIPNRSLTLRPGMFARTTFNMAEVEGVTVLDLAVQKQAGTNERFVFVAKDGKAQRRVVVPGRQVGDRIEVLSGVEANEEVVVAGMARLRDGVEVEIVK